MIRRPKSETGFTILEVLLGVTIFVIGLLGVVALFASSVNGNAFAARLSEASALAANQLEELMRTDYGTGELLDDDGDGTGQDVDDDGVDDDGGNFGLNDAGCGPAGACTDKADGATEGIGRNNTFSVYWNSAPDEPVAGSTTISVIVTWDEKGNQQMLRVAGVRVNELN